MMSTAALLHFSENPEITVFHPRLAPGKDDPTPLVWAIAESHAFLYYFPRDCPRVVCWPLPTTSPEDLHHFFGLTNAEAIVTVEGAWLERIAAARLYQYRLPNESFVPVVPESDPGFHGAHTAQVSVHPLSVEPVGDLLIALRDAQVEIRITASVWPLMDALVASTLHYSGIRLRNAAPRPSP
ncbi:MAG: hypothetical protein H7Z41_19790 [Cytophagales bacterium]|nr:hypothetical protein [Armatimonadota bacterium]